MLWRLVAGSALPCGAMTMMGIEEIRRVRETQGAMASSSLALEAQANFICDADGNVSATQLHSIVAIETMLSRAPMGAVVQTVVSAATVTTEYASSAATATADAAKHAAVATGQAAAWAVETTSNAASRLKRTVTNEDVNAELKAQAERAAGILQALQAQMAKDRYFEQMKAMFAVGVAIAAADGEISDHERADIQEFVAGAAHTALPGEVQTALRHWLQRPPSIDEAFELARQCGEENMHFFDAVIAVAINADDVIHPAELAFKERWHLLRDEVFA